MKLSAAIRLECIKTGLKPADKDSVLREIARLAKQSKHLEKLSEEDIYEGLKQRESVGTTGFGKGIAIPHCRLDKADKFVVGLVTIPDGVEFEALDKKPVKLIVFIIAPETETNKHIKILSAISQALMTPDATEEIVKCETPESAQESLLRHSRDEINSKDHSSKNKFCIFVQDEELFRDVLEIVSGLNPNSVMVMHAQNTREYLTKTPLFASFLGDGYLGFSRIIFAVVEKNLSNEMIRRIENVTGNLDERNDILITVQEIFYAAGSLSP